MYIYKYGGSHAHTHTLHAHHTLTFIDIKCVLNLFVQYFLAIKTLIYFNDKLILLYMIVCAVCAQVCV